MSKIITSGHTDHDDRQEARKLQDSQRDLSVFHPSLEGPRVYSGAIPDHIRSTGRLLGATSPSRDGSGGDRLAIRSDYLLYRVDPR
jgi:hypothetical protein